MNPPMQPDWDTFLELLNCEIDEYLKCAQGRQPKATKVWIAKQLNCDRTTLYKYLDGTNKIPLDMLQALIKLLSLSIEKQQELLFLSGYGIPVPIEVTPPPEPLLSPVILRTALAEAIADVLPVQRFNVLEDQLSLLSGMIADLSKELLSQDDFSQLLRTDIQLLELVQALAGQHIPAGKILVSFDSNNQFSSITIDGLAGVHIMHMHIHLHTVSSTLPILHQLRAPTKDFVGRKKQIEAIVNALTVGNATVISGITGMGGIGKTELALVIGHQLLNDYPDAQIMLNLQGSHKQPIQSTQALRTIIRAFQPESQLPEEEDLLIAAYRSILSDKHVLILVDDAQDAKHIKPLLPPVGSVLLITSRQRFQLPGIQNIDLDCLEIEEATSLLRSICDRLSIEDARKIADSCGCLPLALRIAGGILANDSTLNISQLLQHLSDERSKLSALCDPDDFDLNMRTSIHLSYTLLSHDVQISLQRLGVFSAGFDLEAAQIVLQEADQDLLKGRLGILCRRNLLEYNPTTGRYSLHELIRVFALNELDKEQYRTRLNHAQYYIALAEKAHQYYLAGGKDMHKGLTLFDQERTNLDAARRWLQTQSGNVEVDMLLISEANATALIGDLRYSLRHERIPQMEVALEAAKRCGRRDSQGWFLGYLGNAYADLGEMRRAIDLYTQWLSITRDINDQRGEGMALGSLGNAFLASGDVDLAIEYYQKHLDIAQAIDDKRSIATALGNLGIAYKNLGRTQLAIEFYQQQLIITRSIGDQRGVGTALGNLGVAYTILGEIEKAIDTYQQHLTIAHNIGDRRSEGQTLGNLGTAYADLGQIDRAIGYYEQQLVIAEEMGDQRSEGISLLNTADCLIWINYQKSKELYNIALKIFIDLDSPEGKSYCQIGLGNIAQCEINSNQAFRYYHKAYQLDQASTIAKASWLCGIASLLKGHYIEAQKYWQEASQYSMNMDQILENQYISILIGITQEAMSSSQDTSNSLSALNTMIVQKPLPIHIAEALRDLKNIFQVIGKILVLDEAINILQNHNSLPLPCQIK